MSYALAKYVCHSFGIDYHHPVTGKVSKAPRKRLTSSVKKRKISTKRTK